MPIPFACPYCQEQTLVEDEFAGQSGPCAKCGKSITVPYIPAGEEFAENEIVTFSSDMYTELSVLAGQRDFVVERKEAMERLVRAVVRAEEFLHNNEAEARDIVIRRLTNQPESTVRGVWDAFNAEVANETFKGVLQS